MPVVNRTLGWVFLLTLICLTFAFLAFGAEPPTQPERPPDFGGVVGRCGADTEIWLVGWEEPERIGFYYVARQRQTSMDPTVIVQWDAEGTAVAIWFKGRQWNRTDFITAYAAACDIVDP